MTEISLNDLPKYSPWIHRLMGLSLWEKKEKNEIEILREFDDEKWGNLLKMYKDAQNTLKFKDVEKIVYGGSENNAICVLEKKIFKTSSISAFNKQYELIFNTLKNFLPTKTICEFGAGYGQVILNLAKEKEFGSCDFIAAEYTSSGVELLKCLSSVENLKIGCGFCDLSSSSITDISIPEQSLIYTSFSAMYVPMMNENFVKGFIKFKPKVVVHFEPILQHCENDTMLGSFQSRYIEQNGYNLNLLSILKEAEGRKEIIIHKEIAQVFAPNPLLPMSIIAWSPIYN